MRAIWIVGLSVVLSAIVACSTAGGGAAQAKCSACGNAVKVTCSVDHKCKACDTCMGKCDGCGGEAKLMSLCARDKMCAACDRCAR